MQQQYVQGHMIAKRKELLPNIRKVELFTQEQNFGLISPCQFRGLVNKQRRAHLKSRNTEESPEAQTAMAKEDAQLTAATQELDLIVSLEIQLAATLTAVPPQASVPAASPMLVEAAPARRG